MPSARTRVEGDPLGAFECRASTFDELLSERFRPLPAAKSAAPLATQRLSAWCVASAGGDWNLFARRLARDGLTFDGVLARLAGVATNPGTAGPDWAADAPWVLAALKSAPPALSRPGGEPDAAAAFEPLLAGLVETAWAHVHSAVGEPLSRLVPESALQPLYQAFLVRLSELCAPPLFSALLAWQAAGRDAVGSSNPPAAHPDRYRSTDPDEHAAADRFERFVEQMRATGFDRIFVDKPVLLRLIASVTRQWIDSTVEFVRRLAADLGLIRSTLLGAGSQPRVASVTGGLSDLHNGGRSVLLVTFDDGQRIVYKPKDLRPDLFWHGLVGWLNEHAPPIDLRAARVLVRGGYGWAEFIAHSDCPDAQAVERFYRRAGAWLALFHVFAAADMHFENLIAAGEQPVPIDLEMLLQMGKLPLAGDLAGRAALEHARERIDESIISTGFLPAYARTPENTVIALGGLNESPWEVTETCWEDVNTCRMRPKRRRSVPEPPANLPTLHGTPALLSRFGPALVEGFDQYGRHLLHLRLDLVAPERLDMLRGIPVRRLLRPTRFYASLMKRLQDPRRMDDGAVWSAQLDFVARLAEWDADDPLWPLLRAERDALCALDVPFFRADSDGTRVFDGRGHAAEGHGQAGLARARARLLGWDTAELEWQRRIVSTSVASVPGALARVLPHRSDRSADEAASRAQRRSRFLAAAAEAAARIAALAIRRDGSAAWIGLDWLGDSEVSQLVPLGFDLYNGAPGIALFLAAFARVAADERSAALAIDALAPLRSHLHGANAARMARGLGLGAATGLGSVVYGLATIGVLLEREDLLADAVHAAHLCTDELIDADRSFDLIGGSAGAVLCLLKLQRLTGDATVLERAERCGSHLLLHVAPALERAAAPASRPGWQRLTGISHGAAGLAYAFAALAGVSERSEFALAARDCIAFENRTFSLAQRNWPDLRQQASEQSWPCQWCYGAAGIGLARLATARCRHFDASAVQADVRHAVACTLEASSSSLDHLCCGNLGRIEFLAEAARFLADPALDDDAERRQLGVAADAQANGDYRWTHGDAAFNPGLFRGLAGVGYSMLRRVSPELPNVLVWS